MIIVVLIPLAIIGWIIIRMHNSNVKKEEETKGTFLNQFSCPICNGKNISFTHWGRTPYHVQENTIQMGPNFRRYEIRTYKRELYCIDCGNSFDPWLQLDILTKGNTTEMIDLENKYFTRIEDDTPDLI